MSRTDTWMPLYIGDYLADTGRLTTLGHGAYLLILMDYWRNGPPPDDDSALAAIARVDRRTWDRDLKKVIRSFFHVGSDGLLHQKRVDAEIEKSANISAKRREAARSRHSKTDPSGSSGGGQNSSKSGANAVQMHGLTVVEAQRLRAKRLEDAREKGRHTDEEWRALLEFCGGVCLICGTGDDITKDHVTPISIGGSDAIENIQPLCRSCNSGRPTETQDYRPHGWQDACKCIANAEQVTSESNHTRASRASALPSPSPSPTEISELRSVAAATPMTPTQRLWSEGVANYQVLADCDKIKARAAIGGFRVVAKDDLVVMEAIEAAMQNPPGSPYPFIMAGIKARLDEMKKLPVRKRPPSAPNPDANAWIGELSTDPSHPLFNMPVGGNG